MLDLLQHYSSPAAMKAAGTTRMATRLLKLAPRMGRRLAEEITQALSEQTVVVVGTKAAATVSAVYQSRDRGRRPGSSQTRLS